MLLTRYYPDSPFSFSNELKVKLCAESSSASGPVACVQSLQGANVVRDDELRVDLCGGASSESPALCAKAAPFSMSDEGVVRLCSQAPSKMPAQCAEAIRDSSVQEEQKVKLCVGSASLGPAECLAKARSIYRLETKGAVELCVGADSSAPARCFEEMSSANREFSAPFARAFLVLLCPSVLFSPLLASPRLFNSPHVSNPPAGEITTSMKIGVCRGAGSVAPARCLMLEKDRRSYSRDDERLSADDAVSLCHGASDSLPASCSIALEKHLANRTLRVRLCRSAGAVEGATKEAAADSSSSSTNSINSTRTGTGASTTPSAPHECILGAFRGGQRYLRSEMRDFQDKESLLVELCDSAVSDAPVRCASSRSLHQLSVGQKVELCRGFAGKLGDGPALCFDAASRALGHSVSTASRVALCKGMDTDAPAHCAKASMKNYRMSEEGRLAVCRGAMSVAPAECAASSELRSSTFSSMEEKDFIKLCLGAVSGHHRVECLATLGERRVRGSVGGVLGVPAAAELCATADSEAPFLCARAAIARFRDSAGAQKRRWGDDGFPAFVVSLCSGRNKLSSAVDCVAEAPTSVSGELLVSLCRGASSAAPAVCAAEAERSSHRLSAREIVELCGGANSQAPVVCLDEIPHHLRDSKLRIRLCRGAASTAPVRCFVRLRVGDKALFPAEDQVALCSGALSSGPADCANGALKRIFRGVTGATRDSVPGLVKTLCSGVPVEGEEALQPIICFDGTRSAFGLRPADRAILCGGTLTQAPKLCNAELGPEMSRWTVQHRIRLCRGVVDTFPARCALHAPFSFSSDLKVELCAGALSLAPANCSTRADIYGMTGELRVRLCRGAVSSGAAECARLAPHRWVGLGWRGEGKTERDIEAEREKKRKEEKEEGKREENEREKKERASPIQPQQTERRTNRRALLDGADRRARGLRARPAARCDGDARVSGCGGLQRGKVRDAGALCRSKELLGLGPEQGASARVPPCCLDTDPPRGRAVGSHGQGVQGRSWEPAGARRARRPPRPV